MTMGSITSPTLGKCFIASPIGSPGSSIRKRANFVLQLIQSSIGDLFAIIRADREETLHRIDDQLLLNLIEADLVIADLSTKNANVYFELGIRYALSNKPFICICDKDEIADLPFNVRQIKAIGLPKSLENYGSEYEEFETDKKSAIDSIRSHAESILEKNSNWKSPLGIVAVIIEKLSLPGEDHNILRIILEKINEISVNERKNYSTTNSDLSPLSTHDRVSYAKKKFQKNLFDEAFPIFEKALAETPNDTTILLYLGDCSKASGKEAQALGYYERILELSPSHRAAKDRLGRI